MIPRLLWLAVLVPLPALAVDMADDGSCRNGAFPAGQSDFALAKVTGPARLYLLGDLEGCPGKGEPACRQRSYVVTGDTLITGRDLGSHRCVFFPTTAGGSAGWVDARRLEPLPVRAAPTLPEWAGAWHDGDNTLQLRVRDDHLQVTGDAYWPSSTPTPERPYGPNYGEIGASARPDGASLEVVDDAVGACRLHARWLGEYLVVSDNSQCGGANVRFNGVYRRTPAR